MLALARAVDDAAHHRNVELLDPGIASLPLGHGLLNEALDIAGKLLKSRRRGAPAARAGRNQRKEYAKTHGLQQLLRHLHFEGAVAAGLGGERHTDGV